MLTRALVLLGVAACGGNGLADAGPGITLPDADHSCYLIPAEGSCSPGDGRCLVTLGGAPQGWICVPECGDAGGCRACRDDFECQEELGIHGRCETHCGICCSDQGIGIDGGVPCNCI